jgi:hypothetical protein
MIAQGQVRLLTTRRALTPLVAIACLVPTRKLAGQFLPLALRLMGMGGPTPSRLPPAKAGHLDRNLTHLAPHRIPSFPSHPVSTSYGFTDMTCHHKYHLPIQRQILQHTGAVAPSASGSFFVVPLSQTNHSLQLHRAASILRMELDILQSSSGTGQKPRRLHMQVALRMKTRNAG